MSSEKKARKKRLNLGVSTSGSAVSPTPSPPAGAAAPTEFAAAENSDIFFWDKKLNERGGGE
jgi:hypothetical protein